MDFFSNIISTTSKTTQEVMKEVVTSIAISAEAIVSITTNISSEVTKRVVKSIVNSTNERINTTFDALQTPKAEVFLALAVSWALVLFYAKQEWMAAINSEPAKHAESEKDDRNGFWIDTRNRFNIRIGLATRFGVIWIPVYCGILFTGSVCFDVLFHFRIERIKGRRNDSSTDPSMLRIFLKCLGKE